VTDDSEAQRRAAQARAIVENPVWRESWDLLDQELWGLFQSCPPENGEALRAVALRRWALGTIRAELERVIAQPMLDEINSE